jgi:hypothetical protein
MQLAMEENAYAEFLHMAAEEEDGVYNEEEHTTSNDAHVCDMYYQVVCCSHTLFSSYEIICPQCMCARTFFLSMFSYL